MMIHFAQGFVLSASQFEVKHSVSPPETRSTGTEKLFAGMETRSACAVTRSGGAVTHSVYAVTRFVCVAARPEVART